MDVVWGNKSVLLNSSAAESNTESDSGSETNYLLFFVISTIIIAFGLVGNCSSFVLFSCSEFCRMSFAVYMRALAVSDSVVLLVNLGEDVNGKLLDGLLSNIRVLCPLGVFFTFFGRLFSSFLVVAVATDRYVAVVHPLRRATLCTFRRSLVVLGAIVVLTTAICLSFVVWTEILTHPAVPSTNYTCVVEDDFPFFVATYGTYFGLVFTVPFVMVGFLNIRVFLHIKTAINTRKVLSRTSTTLGDAVLKRTMSLILATFVSVLANMPLAIVELTELATDSGLREAYNISVLIHMLNYSLNFYIVVLHGRDYRRALWRACGCRPRVPRHDKSASSGSTSLASISGTGK